VCVVGSGEGGTGLGFFLALATIESIPKQVDPPVQLTKTRAHPTRQVCAFKKEKNGVKIYTVKEGRIPDPRNSGTGLPVARVGEAVIQAPIEQVGLLLFVWFVCLCLWEAT
jgi:hypothetical protein